MGSLNDDSIVLYADQEHSGLRTAVFVLLFITLVLVYLAIRALIVALNPEGLPDFTFAMACGGAFPIALGIVWLAEKVMKKYWPSGRSVTLTNDGMMVQAESGKPKRISLASEPTALFWTFSLKGWQRGGRERRVPRNWVCLAAQIQASKNRAIVYSYLPKNKAQKWLDLKEGQVKFYEIFPKEVYDNSISSRLKGPSRPEIPAAVLTGKSGSYWLAERHRWQEGFELPPKEFEQFMNHVQTTLLN